MNRKNIFNLKSRLRFSNPINVNHFEDGFVVYTILPGGVEPIIFRSRELWYSMTRLANRIRDAGFVPSKEIIETECEGRLW